MIPFLPFFAIMSFGVRIHALSSSARVLGSGLGERVLDVGVAALAGGLGAVVDGLAGGGVTGERRRREAHGEDGNGEDEEDGASLKPPVIVPDDSVRVTPSLSPPRPCPRKCR